MKWLAFTHGSTPASSYCDFSAVLDYEALWLLAGAVLVVALAGCRSVVSDHRITANSAAIPSARVSSANSGPITLVGGKTATVEQFKGHLLIVWFLAGGCANCAVSTPVVAQQLPIFTAAHPQIRVLGLPADCQAGTAGLTELRPLAHAAGDSTLKDATWLWGMASLPVGQAYDPIGTADAYVLSAPSGDVTYSNSVPVSTMGILPQKRNQITVAR